MSYQVELQQSQCQQTKVILENPNTTVKKSVDFIYKVTGLTVSTILYLRNIFPEKAFSLQNILGTKCHLIEERAEIPETGTLINWISSAFETVRTHKLKKMIIIIQKPNGYEILETYTFNFSYNFDAISCHLMNETTGQDMLIKSKAVPKMIQREFKQLIRSVLKLTEDLQPLPAKFFMSLGLELNEKVADDFNYPKHFKAVDSLCINFPLETDSLGKVESRFIGTDLTINSVLNQRDKENNHVNEGQSSQQQQGSLDSSSNKTPPDDSTGQRKRLKYAANRRLSNIKPFS